MILVDTKINKLLGRKHFNEKQDILSNSSYQINKNITSYAEWTSNTIEVRQKKLADIAAEVWKIPDIHN